jgi:hypothetical protein
MDASMAGVAGGLIEIAVVEEPPRSASPASRAARTSAASAAGSSTAPRARDGCSSTVGALASDTDALEREPSPTRVHPLFSSPRRSVTGMTASSKKIADFGLACQLGIGG